MAVSSAVRVINDTISPKSSGKVLSFEQPERIRVSRDFNMEKPFGRDLRHLQSFKFIKMSAFSSPMVGCNSTKLLQSLSFSVSRLGSFENSGVYVR